MKLPKHDSLTFDQKIMKLRYLIPFYILLASVTFCGRKIADDNDANKAPKDVTTNPSLITGTLELDKKTDSIYADIWMRVPNADYKSVDNMVLETGESFKGVSFMYYDSVNNAPDNGNDTIPMHVVFRFKNDKNWQVNDSIRVMSLNEEDQTTFRELKNYFELRMDF
ncbi:MAG: hypothetical protein EOO45_22550, partial [Flavobacterium sp.]